MRICVCCIQVHPLSSVWMNCFFKGLPLSLHYWKNALYSNLWIIYFVDSKWIFFYILMCIRCPIWNIFSTEVLYTTCEIFEELSVFISNITVGNFLSMLKLFVTLLRTPFQCLFKLYIRELCFNLYFYFYRWPSGSRSISPGVRRRSSGSVLSPHSSKSELSSVRKGSSTQVDSCSSYPRVRANSWVSGPPSQSYRPMRSTSLVLMVRLCKLVMLCTSSWQL